MPRARKDFIREDIERAMRSTLSNRAASRFLGCSYQHYKMWAKRYTSNKDEYETLFHEHLNPYGKGIPKHLNVKGKEPPLIDILEGKMNTASFSPDKIKFRLIAEGLLDEECTVCGFHERRVTDYKIPLLLHFKDKNKMNYQIVNLQLLCYNCFFLHIANVFTDDEIRGIEDYVTVKAKKVEWELSEHDKKKIKETKLPDVLNVDNLNDIISKM